MSDIDEALGVLDRLDRYLRWELGHKDELIAQLQTIRAALEQQSPDDSIGAAEILIDGVRNLTGLEGEASIPWAIEAMERLYQRRW